MAHINSFTGRLYYLNGVWSRTGWYSYFFETIALKTPLVLLVPALVSCAAVAWRLGRYFVHPTLKGRLSRPQWLLLWVPTLVLFGLTVISRTNLGHRYVLFIYLPLCVTLGLELAKWWRSKSGRLLAIMILLANLVTFTVAYPHFETYFNELIRTPYRGMKYLADSNIDWGEDLPLLGETLKGAARPSVNAALFTSGKPEAYGVTNYRWILPHYQFVIHPPDAKMPDPGLPSVMTLNGLMAARDLYPALYTKDPDVVENSAVFFLPERQDSIK
jgi:hypothetical protein